MAGTSDKRRNITETGQERARLLVSGYFIAAAIGIIPYDAGRAMVGAVVDPGLTPVVFSVLLFAPGYSLLTGRSIRLSAIALALLVLAASRYEAGTGAALREFALLVGLAMICAVPTTRKAADFAPRRIRLGRSATAASAPVPASAGRHAAIAQSPDELAGLFEQLVEIG